jgi:DNA-binding MarR family transcriptional regulator
MIRTRPLLNGVPTLEPKLKKREFFGFKTRGSTDWYSAGITAQEALAILALMLNTSDDGVSYASQTVLAETVICSRPTITKGLHSLLKRGLVFRIEGKRAQYRLSESTGTKLA